MQRTQTLYHNAVYWFGALAVFAVVGFWPTYFSKLTTASAHAHAHGLAMSLWCVLLISQAWLIRTGRRDIHRRLGKVSFLLVPIVVVATVSFAHVNVRADGLTPIRLYILYLQVHLILLFLIAYGLAMYHRRQPVMHARFMICTALTLIDPVLVRIIFFNIWTPDHLIYLQAITYSVTDLVLVALIMSDWRRELRLGVYPAMLALFVLFQIPTFFLDHLPVWNSFAAWFMGLPLS